MIISPERRVARVKGSTVLSVSSIVELILAVILIAGQIIYENL